MRTASYVVALLALVLATLGVRGVAASEHAAAQTYEDLYTVPPPEWLRVLSSGYDDALAVLLWCSALVYQGDELIHSGGLDHVFDYAEAILALDPDFRAVYVWISSAGLYSPAGVTESDMSRTIDIIRRGRQRFPDDGELAWVLGATLAFEAPPYTPEARRDAVRLEGLENLTVAARLGAAPDWLVLSNTSMLTQLGRADRAIEHLEEMYALVSDEQVRAQIAERIEQVRSDVYGAAFVDANERLEEERLRAFPYISPDLYLLVAPSQDPDAWAEWESEE
jgi:tetratricopeptide (TPR) repeat protein